MPESYLNTNLSVIISSPAGSGKTEKLARRFIGLIEAGTEVERILCITFTEKAAAEMKQRILSILEREHPDKLESIREKIPLMRISTIHAFCLKVLKRFSIELKMDPSLEVMDEQASEDLWTEAVYESLMSESSGERPFFEAIRARGLKGWQTVRRALNEIHLKSPDPELLLGSPDATLNMEPEAASMLGLYSECLARYKRKKREHHLLDFNDLELLAYRSLSLGEQSHNILYSFDEHTDHLLVDEFQDTSSLQWMIIDKLTEEWRSGLGAKRSGGLKPTIFLVGDEKQSIYLFRGANVSVFRDAGDKLTEWMGDDYRFLEVKENYRSLGAITDFTNALFESLMLPDPAEGWMTRYSPFEHTREGDGKVELLLFDGEVNTKETRQKEAGVLAEKILELVGRHEVIEDDKKRPCRFEDMGILLRRRTHLGVLESELHSAGVPFIVLKGIGFFEEPEVAMLRELVSFLTEPGADHALFCLLRSPLFGLHYHELTPLVKQKSSLLEALKDSGSERFIEIAGRLLGWKFSLSEMPLAEVLESALSGSGAWSHYGEPQRHANIKKFLLLVEGMESEGLSLLEIRERLIRQRNARDVSKANVNAEGMDAVRIMTIHAAKGLQFPMVFLPGMDERLAAKSGPVVFHETATGSTLYYEEDSAKRRKLDPFRLQKLKEEEEQKRLFYVAVTRAMDYLCMSGAQLQGKKAHQGRLSYLDDAFGLSGEDSELPFTLTHIEKAPLLRSPVTPAVRAGIKDGPKTPDVASYTSPIDYTPSAANTQWFNVTDDITSIRKNHGRDWVITGTVLHQILEELSLRAIAAPSEAVKRARELVAGKLPDGPRREEVIKRIAASMDKMASSGILEEIVLPDDANSYTELPFVLESGSHVYRGRIDRVLVRGNEVLVYDYKSFPVRPEDEQELVLQYSNQMSRYSAAARRIFGLKPKAFLVLTYEGRVTDPFI